MSRNPAPTPDKWSRRILLRYALLQLPALGLLTAGLLLLHQWGALPRAVPWLVLGGWLLKDIVLYPLVWRSYDPDPHPQGNSLLGKTGRVVRVNGSGAMIEIHGELWRARPATPDTTLAIGTRVRVLDLEGLTLVVEAVAQ